MVCKKKLIILKNILNAVRLFEKRMKMAKLLDTKLKNPFEFPQNSKRKTVRSCINTKKIRD